MKEIGAIVDKPSTLIFERLKEAIELKITTAENIKQIVVFLEEDT